MAVEGTLRPGAQAAQLSLNMKLLGHNELAGFGGVGEGINMQAAEGRAAHPVAGARVRAQELHRGGRHRSAQPQDGGPDRPAARRRAVELARRRGQHHGGRLPDQEVGTEARGHGPLRHQQAGRAEADLAFRPLGSELARRALRVVRRRAIRPSHLRRGRLRAEQPKDDQFYQHHRRAQSVEAGGGRALVAARHPQGRLRAAAAAPPRFDGGYRPHNTNVYPQRPDRAYIGYIDGGTMDPRHQPTRRAQAGRARWRHSPPYNGFTHTVLPLFNESGTLSSPTSASGTTARTGPSSRGWWTAREETNLVPIATLPLPPAETFIKRGGRFGAHNLHENLPGPCSCRSETTSMLRHVLQWRRARIRRFQSPAATRDRLFRARHAASWRPRARPRSTTCAWTTGGSFMPSTASAAASNAWK